MDQGLKVLILEDADFDAVLIEYELEKLKLPCNYRRAVTREEFLQALEEYRPDLILADYRLPSFNGLTALALVQEVCPEVPFIFVSGAMSPELAQVGLNQGAADWIPKDQLSQLSAAVERSLCGLDPGPASAREPGGLEEEPQPALFQRTKKAMVVLGLNGAILEFNRGAELLTGWQRHEVLGLDLIELLVEREKWGWALGKLGQAAAGETLPGFEVAIRSRSGAACRWFCQLTLLENLQGRAEMILLMADDLNHILEKGRDQARRTFTVKGRPNLIC